MVATELGIRCGNCQKFDTFQVDGVPFGKTKPGAGEEVNQGVCRAPFGLKLGVKTENSPCTQKPPEEFFVPKDRTP